MCAEHFVETTGGNVKDNGNKNIAVCLVVQPVHQDYKRNKAKREVEAVEKSRLGHVAMVVVLNER